MANENGNLPVLNVLAPEFASSTTFSNGNRTVTSTSASALTNAPFTFGVKAVGNTGIYYCEFNIDVAGNDTTYAGMARASWAGWGGSTNSYLGYGIASAGGGDGEGVAILQTGSSGSGKFNTYSNGSAGTAGNVTVANNDRLCAALDTATGKAWVGFFDVSGDQQYWLDNDGTERTSDVPALGDYQNITFTAADGDIVFAVACRAFQGNNGTLTIKPHPADWLGTPPDGAKGVSSQTLTEPAVINPDEHFFSKVVDHDGSSTVTTCSFNLETNEWLAIIKNTTGAAEGWYMIDSVRGVTKVVFMNTTAAETTDANVLTVSGATFTLGSTLSDKDYYVEFHKAGLTSAKASNTEGSLNTTATSANTTSGFAISTYVGEGANRTYGHGLDSAPEWTITKLRVGADQGNYAWHVKLGGGTKIIYPHLDNAVDTEASIFNSTVPSATLNSLGNQVGVNTDDYTYVNWSWHGVEGYSLFSDYVGNLDADGPVVVMSGSPAASMTKRNEAGWNWNYHAQVLGANENYQYLIPNATTAMNTTSSVNEMDFLANGRKIRDGGNNNVNGDGIQHLTMDWGGRPLTDNAINQGRAGAVQQYGLGYGGTITFDGTDVIHVFTVSGTFTLPVAPTGGIDYLVIAGGGGGGSAFSGGGGAGGYRNSFNSETSGGGGSSETALALSSGSYTVTVGAAGAAGTSQGSGGAGGNSVFATITSVGGGGGAGAGIDIDGVVGGSGGGGSGDNRSGQVAGDGTSNQGFDGGIGDYDGNANNAGGGGGAGTVGVAGDATDAGTGGNGLASTITGASVTRGGGGGGGAFAAGGGVAANGGSGGGGNGSSSGVGAAGSANTGGGGGGSKTGTNGGAGGTGVVIIRYTI